MARGRRDPVSAGRAGGARVRLVPDPRRTPQTHSPRTTPLPVRSSGLPSGQMPSRAWLHAGSATCRSIRCARTSRIVGDEATILRARDTQRSQFRSEVLLGRSGLLACPQITAVFCERVVAVHLDVRRGGHRRSQVENASPYCSQWAEVTYFRKLRLDSAEAKIKFRGRNLSGFAGLVAQ
jgi:hypothetical protein